MNAALLLSVLASTATPEALTFDQALGFAAASPAVAGASAAVEEKRRLDAEVSRFTTNPDLLLQPRLGRGRPEGEAQLALSWNLSGLSGARRAGARHETEALAALARATALTRRLDAARAWIDLWAAQRAHELAREELEIATDLASRTERAAGAAALTRADAADAAAYAAEARLLAISVEGEVTDLGYLLGERVSRGAGRPAVAGGPLPHPALPGREAMPRLVEAARALPEVAARELSARAERARAAEARAARGPSLTLGGRAVRDGRGDAFYAMAGISLPLFDRGEREAGVPTAAAARLEGEARDAAGAASAELARAFHEVEHSAEMLDALATALVPAAVESARLREAALRAGDATVLEVLVARRAAASGRARAARAQATHAWARAKLWLLLAEISNQGETP